MEVVKRRLVISTAYDLRMSVVSRKEFMRFTVDVVYVSRTPSAKWGSYRGTVYDVIRTPPPPSQPPSRLSPPSCPSSLFPKITWMTSLPRMSQGPWGAATVASSEAL